MTDQDTRQPYVFSFEAGDGKNKQLLGGKGANLCEMTQIGLNVPPGFVISTEACLAFLDSPGGEGIADEQDSCPVGGRTVEDVGECLFESESVGHDEIRFPQPGYIVGRSTVGVRVLCARHEYVDGDALAECLSYDISQD